MELVQEFGVALSAGERDLFFELLQSYTDVIEWSTTDPGRTDKLQHHIHTGDACPVRQSVCCIPPHCCDDFWTACSREKSSSLPQAPGHRL